MHAAHMCCGIFLQGGGVRSKGEVFQKKFSRDEAAMGDKGIPGEKPNFQRGPPRDKV